MVSVVVRWEWAKSFDVGEDSNHCSILLVELIVVVEDEHQLWFAGLAIVSALGLVSPVQSRRFGDVYLGQDEVGVEANRHGIDLRIAWEKMSKEVSGIGRNGWPL